MVLKWYMLFMLIFSVCGYQLSLFHEYRKLEIEKQHNPYWLNIPQYLNGTQNLYDVNGTVINAGESHTPNWLMDEPPFRPWFHQFVRKYPYQEINRPYRISPVYHLIEKWNLLNVYDRVSKNVGCYCTTAWKLYTPLAGCAVLTRRHILTTATSTELILKKVRFISNLDKILGFWYEIFDGKKRNNTYYSSVSRIHYHPQYVRPEKVNISHPFPFFADLAVWATPKILPSATMFCDRAAPSWRWYEHTKPYPSQKILIIGHQFIKAHGKVPNVWFKYAVRSVGYMDKCPKVEWGEFFCIGEAQTESFAKYGIESGAAYHRIIAEYRPAWWQGYDGLAAMCAFSLNLRSHGIVHYFTVLNVHHVMNFMYDAYTGQLPYVWLDYRYQDTKGKAPIPKPWHRVPYGMWPQYNQEQYTEKFSPVY